MQFAAQVLIMESVPFVFCFYYCFSPFVFKSLLGTAKCGGEGAKHFVLILPCKKFLVPVAYTTHFNGYPVRL
jgi:hypothetical protein